jgi:hypothetical protein
MICSSSTHQHHGLHATARHTIQQLAETNQCAHRTATMKLRLHQAVDGLILLGKQNYCQKLGMAIYRQLQISDISISYIYIFRYIAAQYRY